MTDYSRGDYADLPSDTTDLENNYSAPDLTAIASNDNSTYAEQTANNQYAIHQYKKTVTGQYANILWSGKSTLAPSESPVILEVYNVQDGIWEELDRDDSTSANADFDLSYNEMVSDDYLNNGIVAWRVYQGVVPATEKPAYPATLNAEHPLASGLIGDWLLNEGSGTTLHDTAGSNDATVVDDISWGTGPLGAELANFGVGYFTVGSINWGNNCTMIAWLNPGVP